MSSLTLTDKGLYCESGDFFIDPWGSVDRAIVTHAHADHARPGHRHYLTANEGRHALRRRAGKGATIETIRYGKSIRMGDAIVSLYPAGHIIGSSQVLVDVNGSRTVVTGDYKTRPDPTCTAFELVPCDTLITESTFGLPVYGWPDDTKVFDEINRWWHRNAVDGRASVLFAYALGKAQRVLAGADPSIGPIYTHGAVEAMNEVYRQTGVKLPKTIYATDLDKSTGRFEDALILAPPGANGTTWLQRFAPFSTGFASGWMAIRGRRRQRSVDRGFVLSDHVDWKGLMDVVKESGASVVLPTHGFTDQVARYLREKGLESEPLDTLFEGELDDDALTAG